MPRRVGVTFNPARRGGRTMPRCSDRFDAGILAAAVCESGGGSRTPEAGRAHAGDRYQ